MKLSVACALVLDTKAKGKSFWQKEAKTPMSSFLETTA